MKRVGEVITAAEVITGALKEYPLAEFFTLQKFSEGIFFADCCYIRPRQRCSATL